MRIATTRERFREVLGGRPRAKVLIETSTESEWVARWLEDLGHELIVADPGFAPMYGMRTRRVKTDLRDARALAEACRSGTYRLAHRRSERQRRVAAIVKVNEELAWCDAAVEHATKNDPSVALLRTAPRIGPITAASFRATIDTVERFHGPHQVAAYLGLVPREMSSGEKQHRGRITRAGDSRTRHLLVQASQRIRYSRVPETLGLRTWAKRIEARRGRAELEKTDCTGDQEGAD